MRLISFQPVVCVPEITRCPVFRCEMVPVTNNAMIMKSWKTLIVLNIFFRSTIFIILFFVLTSFYMNQNYRTDLKHYANVVGIYLNSKYTIRHDLSMSRIVTTFDGIRLQYIIHFLLLI